MDWLKDYWAIIIALLSGAVWIGKVQRDVEDLKNGKFVSNERCGERRQEIRDRNDLQFSSGERQFAEIKSSILRIEESQAKIVDMLIEGKNK